MVAPIGSALLIAAALFLFGGPGEDTIQTVLFLLGLGVAALQPLFGEHSPREADVALGAGHVDVKGAGLLNQRIRGRKVDGASTAYLDQGGVGLDLRHRGRPIALELRDESDANAVRDALGIGHHGFGKVGWPTATYPQLRKWFPIAVIPLLFLVIHNNKALAPYVLTGVNVFIVGLVLAVVNHRSKKKLPRGVELEPRGVVLRDPLCEIPYRAILDVGATPDGIWILTDPQFHQGRLDIRTRGSLTTDERSHCIAQITAAVRRARGLGPREPLVSGQVEDLGRGGANARAWLLRLDAIAQQMVSGAGYRGSAMDQTELWEALENHEADVHVRAAAARVLARTDKESRKRIQAIARSARDKKTEKRIRIVLDSDVDQASSELDELDKSARVVKSFLYE